MNNNKQFASCLLYRGVFRDKWICEIGYNYEEVCQEEIALTPYIEEVKRLHSVVPYTAKEDISQELNKLTKGRVVYVDKK